MRKMVDNLLKPGVSDNTVNQVEGMLLNFGKTTNETGYNEQSVPENIAEEENRNASQSHLNKKRGKKASKLATIQEQLIFDEEKIGGASKKDGWFEETKEKQHGTKEIKTR